MNLDLLRTLVDEAYPAAAAARRHIHAHPELSGKETGTAAYIAEQLRALGCVPKLWVGGTGVSLTLGSGEGPVIVLRADTDALPITETTGVPFSSTNPGVMHACGHDVHIASLLGAAAVLKKLETELTGTLVLLFQPNEEAEDSGALRLIEEGAYPDNVTATFGLHVTHESEIGILAMKPGPDYASPLGFDVTVYGKGGHGAHPDAAVDPIVCAAQIIVGLQTLVSREKHPAEPAVLTVGSIHGGTRRNIIPPSVSFTGTVRTFDDTLQTQFMTRIRAFCEETAIAMRCRAEVVLEKSYPSGYNDPALWERMRPVFENWFGAENVIIRKYPTMGAEDFAYYARRNPAIFANIGVMAPGQAFASSIHCPDFLPLEEAIRNGIAAHVCFALEMAGTPG